MSIEHEIRDQIASLIGLLWDAGFFDDIKEDSVFYWAGGYLANISQFYAAQSPILN